MTVVLNLDEAVEYKYTIEEALKAIEQTPEDRGLWVYESGSENIWWYDGLNRKWHEEPTHGKRFYMTHLIHCDTIYSFNGTDVNTHNYLTVM